jgi:hypothetical protein
VIFFKKEIQMTTYTYTARNIHNPEKILTFTIQGDYIKVNLTGLEENLTDLISGDEDQGNSVSKLVDQAGPTALKVMEGISGPIHINDVKLDLKGDEEDHFRIILWKRLAGLRAAPIVLDMGEIDNPPAARRFKEELTKRQEIAGKISKFLGPLDYWLGWIGMVVLTLILIRHPSDD